MTDQAVRHLKQYTSLFAAFAQTARAELSLILKVQEYCYANMTFMRAFQKIIMLFYKTDVISEQVGVLVFCAFLYTYNFVAFLLVVGNPEMV